MKLRKDQAMTDGLINLAMPSSPLTAEELAMRGVGMRGLIDKEVPTFSPPTDDEILAYIDAAVGPNGLQVREAYLKKFGLMPSPEQIALAERQRRTR